MADDEITVKVPGLGGALQLGRGFMGKSSVVLIFLFILLTSAILRLTTEWMILAVAAVALATFCFWFCVLAKLIRLDPAGSLAEGGGDYEKISQSLARTKETPPTAPEEQTPPDQLPGTPI